MIEVCGKHVGIVWWWYARVEIKYIRQRFMMARMRNHSLLLYGDIQHRFEMALVIVLVHNLLHL